MGRNFPGAGGNTVVVAQTGVINDIFNGGGQVSMHLQVVASDRTIYSKSAVNLGYFFSNTVSRALEFFANFDGGDGRYVSGGGLMTSLVYSLYAIDYVTSTGAHPINVFRDNGSVTMSIINIPGGNYLTDATIDLTLGSGVGSPWNGLMAEYAMWSVILSTNSKTSLNNGVNPFVVERDNLELYIPMYGNQTLSPTKQIEADYSPNHLAVTVTATTKAKHVNVQLLEEYV